MRVLLVDDETRVRSALRLLLSQEDGIEIVGEAGDVKDVLHYACTTRPDVALLDWELPGFRNPDLLRALKFLFPDMKVIVLSRRPERRDEALATGAVAFVWKGDAPEHLLHAVQQIRRSERTH